MTVRIDHWSGTLRTMSVGARIDQDQSITVIIDKNLEIDFFNRLFLKKSCFVPLYFNLSALI